jgi:hypothetical protein
MKLVLLLMALTIVGCSANAASPAGDQSTSQPATQSATRPILGLPAGWELAAKGEYSAIQRAGEVTIRARGENPTGGWEMKLAQSPLRIWPPQWMLASKKPDGIATQAFTPFDVSTSFKSDQPVKQIVVTDAAGRHEVAVEQK